MEVSGTRSKVRRPWVSLHEIENLTGIEPFAWCWGNGTDKLSVCECSKKTFT